MSHYLIYERRQTMKKKLTFWIFTTMLVSTLLTACAAPAATPTPAATLAPDTVVAEGHVIPAQDLKLAFSARGKVAEIKVSEGASVKKGDILISLADREQAQASLASAQLELSQAQKTYDDFIRTAGIASADAWDKYQKAQVTRAKAELEWEKINPNTVRDDVDSADAEVKDKKKLLDDAIEALAKYLDLKTDNPTRRSAEDDVRKAEADYNTALRKVEEIQRTADAPRAILDAAIAAEAEAKRTYENTVNGAPEPEQKSVLEARLNNAKAQVAAAQNSLDNFDLRAPFDGVVTDVNVTMGQMIGSDATWAVQMADFSAWYIETSDLTELEVVHVINGQTVEIRPDALPELVLKGTVESISQSSKTQGGDVLYTVKIKLNDYDPALRWGMTVEATFIP
jgi:multidrug resistance efflux pump